MARKLRKFENGNGEAEFGPGHNGGMIDPVALDGYVLRAAGVMKEQKRLGDELKEICAEGDEAGVASKKEIRRLARESLMDQEVLYAQLERMHALRRALGPLGGTPLGQAAETADQPPWVEQ